MPQFNRSATLVLGKPGGAGVALRGLRLRFGVKKDLFATPNEATIEVFNLSERTRNKIKQYETQMILSAGYTQDIGEQILFSGQVYVVNHEVKPPDVRTQLQTADGLSALRDMKLGISYGPGSSVTDVARQIAGKIGLPVKSIPETGKSFANGFSFVGSAEQALRKLSAAGGLEHSVQDGQLQFIKERGATDEQAVVVSVGTGLIGSPEQCVDGEERLAGVQPFVRWKFKVLLNPRITPARRVQITSRFCNGVFRVQKVTHVGDTHGQEWHSECEVSNEFG